MTKFHTDKSLKESDGSEMKYVENHYLFVSGAPSWQIDVAATEHLFRVIMLYARVHVCSSLLFQSLK